MTEETKPAPVPPEAPKPPETPPIAPPIAPPTAPPTAPMPRSQEPAQEPVAEPPKEPEPPIGAIADPATPSGLFKPASDAQLAAFPPPQPPVSSDPAVTVPAPPPGAAPPPQGVFPLASPEQMQRPQPTYVEDKEPPPRQPKTFYELSDKTQHEVRAGWERAHPGQTFDADAWVEPHIRSAREKLGEKEMAHRGTKPVGDNFAEKEPPPVNEKTRAEMEAGRQAVERRNADASKVRAAVAERQAQRLEGGDAPVPDDMNYNAGRR